MQFCGRCAVTNGGRERISYNLRAVVSALREIARNTDSHLEDAIAEIVAVLESDTVLKDDEANTILLRLVKAFRGNATALNILNLLDESGSEAALREVERLEIRRKR